MQETEYPSYQSLLEILDICPWAIHTYFILYKNHERFSLKVYLEDVEDIYLISPAIFKQHLLDLTRLDILSFQLANDFIKIKLYPNEIDAEGLMLC